MPGLKQSLHNAPHVLVKENAKFPREGKAKTRTQGGSEAAEEVLSQVPSPGSSQVSTQDSSQLTTQGSSQVPIPIPYSDPFQVAYQDPFPVPEQFLSQIPSQSVPRNANYGVQASPSRVNSFAVEECSENIIHESIYGAQGTSANASMEGALDTRSSVAPLHSRASKRMIQVDSSSLSEEDEELIAANAAAQILANIKLTSNQQNKRCAKTKDSSNTQKTNANISAKLPLNQDKNLKSSFAEKQKMRDGAKIEKITERIKRKDLQRTELDKKQHSVSKSKNVETNSSKSTESRQASKKTDQKAQKSQNTVGKGHSWEKAIHVDEEFCWQEAIDVDKINENDLLKKVIDLTAEDSESPTKFMSKQSSKSISKDDFVETNFVIRKFYLKKPVKVEKEMKQEK